VSDEAPGKRMAAASTAAVFVSHSAPSGLRWKVVKEEEAAMNMLVKPAVASAGSRPRLIPESQRLVLHNIRWDSYVAIGALLPDRPCLRLTYDRGTLEFMTTSAEHEIYKKRLGRLIETLAEECGLRIASAGNMTFQIEELERGLEPDDCYWIAHEESMRTRMAWDAKLDPPPDLVVEIEISRSAVDRMGVYAALGVPEVWRCDGTTLRANLLQPNGEWQEAGISPTFPKIPLAGLVPFLQPNADLDYLSMIRTFRAWIGEQLAHS
jgi:Uma2 family endonuclease